jgi:CubicO group peptidase (beta-lactamase class C family)
VTAATGLAETAARLVAGVPAGLPTGATPPAGVGLALRAPGVSQSAAAGLRGLPERGADAPAMTVNTHHDLASVTKIVATTAALVRLVSEGLVGLDDEVRRYLPGFSAGPKAAVTVRQLLQHRGGLAEWHPLYLAAQGADAASALAQDLPLRHRPGSARHYSDLGFMLLGRVVARAAGQPLPEAVETLVTGPLGMSSTRFARPAGSEVATSSFGDQVEMTMIDTGVPYPVPYRSDQFGGWRLSPVTGEVGDGNAFHVFDGVSGHAGLFSTLADLVGFAGAFANYREHDGLWKAEVAEEFFAPGPDPDQALGFRRYTLDVGRERIDLLGHPGFVGCAVGFAPGRGIALALASNRLLTPGTPVPTDRLWQQALAAAGEALGLEDSLGEQPA